MDNISSQDLFGVEFDPLYSEIEATLALQDESADPLSTSNEPQKINWRLVAEQSAKLLEQCYDLRVALWLIRANTHRKGISAFFQGLAELDLRITESQDPLYPISEDEPANSGHAAALGWLSTAQCLAEFKSARLSAEHPHTVQELINTDNDSGRFISVSVSQLLAVDTHFQKNGFPDLLMQLTTIQEIIKRIGDYANIHSEGYQLDCNQLHAFLAKCINSLSQSNTYNARSNIELNESTASPMPHEPPILSAENIHIHSRQEIIIMLDRILEYFQHVEPSHPAPIFIRRTKQMIGMDFISIVEDLLPESLDALQQFTGK